MRRIRIFNNFTIFLLCVLCVSAYADTFIPYNEVQQSSSIAKDRNGNIVIHDLLAVAQLVRQIPILGRMLNVFFIWLVNIVTISELETNNLLDKIIRDFFPCVITSTRITCDGVYRNGGLIKIVKHAVDTMPDTPTLYILKKVIGVLLCYLTDLNMSALLT